MKQQLPLFLCCALASGGAWAENTPATEQPAAPSAEPAVQRTVVEDEGSRISELRVRGQTQRITVQPKVGGAKAYEIIPADGGRHIDDGGTAGKRVWNVLSF